MELKDLSEILTRACGFLVCTGAGMSADSGIPVYRRDCHYIEQNTTDNQEDIDHPESGKLRGSKELKQSWGPPSVEFEDRYPGLTVEDLHDFGNSEIFPKKSLLLWKHFFDQRELFLNKEPHSGYSALLNLIGSKDYFVLTSNIDGFHARSGTPTDKIIECHGSLLTSDTSRYFRVQCSSGSLCNMDIWNFKFPPTIEDSDDIKDDDLPRCPKCHSVARPNYLSFNDDTCLVNVFTFDSPSRKKMIEWLETVQKNNTPIIIFEIGVGDAVLTVRNRSRKTWRECQNSYLIRINPSPDIAPLPERYLNLSMGCQEAMSLILNLMTQKKSA